MLLCYYHQLQQSSSESHVDLDFPFRVLSAQCTRSRRKRSTDASGGTPFALSAIMILIDLLLDQQPNTDVPDSSGLTPLHAAFNNTRTTLFRSNVEGIKKPECKETD